MEPRPQLTRMNHALPFEKLGPADFERLCLWLVEQTGYAEAEALGEAGSEQGRDIVAWKDGLRVAFQCKRVRQFGAKSALVEVEKIRSLPEEEQPDELVFVVTCAVSAKTRKAARVSWGKDKTCHFWAGSELDHKVKQYPEIVEEFFNAAVEDRSRAQVVAYDRGAAIGGNVVGSPVVTGQNVVVNINSGLLAAAEESASAGLASQKSTLMQVSSNLGVSEPAPPRPKTSAPI